MPGVNVAIYWSFVPNGIWKLIAYEEELLQIKLCLIVVFYFNQSKH